jgi:hypothetical protein
LAKPELRVVFPVPGQPETIIAFLKKHHPKNKNRTTIKVIKNAPKIRLFIKKIKNRKAPNKA